MKVVDFIGITAGVALVGQWIRIDFARDALVSQAAWVVLMTGLAFVLLLAVSHYAVLLAAVRKGPGMILVYVLGVVWIVTIITMYRWREIASHAGLTVSVAIVMVWFALRGEQVTQALAERFPISENERRAMVSRDPPESYGDFFLVHCAMLFLLVMPWLAKFFHR